MYNKSYQVLFNHSIWKYTHIYILHILYITMTIAIIHFNFTFNSSHFIKSFHIWTILFTTNITIIKILVYKYLILVLIHIQPKYYNIQEIQTAAFSNKEVTWSSTLTQPFAVMNIPSSSSSSAFIGSGCNNCNWLIASKRLSTICYSIS